MGCQHEDCGLYFQFTVDMNGSFRRGSSLYCALKDGSEAAYQKLIAQLKRVLPATGETLSFSISVICSCCNQVLARTQLYRLTDNRLANMRKKLNDEIEKAERLVGQTEKQKILVNALAMSLLDMAVEVIEEWQLENSIAAMFSHLSPSGPFGIAG